MRKNYVGKTHQNSVFSHYIFQNKGQQRIPLCKHPGTNVVYAVNIMLGLVSHNHCFGCFFWKISHPLSSFSSLRLKKSEGIVCILRVLHLALTSVYSPADETTAAGVSLTIIPAKGLYWPKAINMSNEPRCCLERHCLLPHFYGNEQLTRRCAVRYLST